MNRSLDGWEGNGREPVTRSIHKMLRYGYCSRDRGLNDDRKVSGVFTEDAEDLALDGDACGGGEDGSHLGVGGLETDHISLAVEALEGGIRAVDQSDDDLAFAGGAGTLDEDVVAGDDVFVAHGVAANLEGEDLAVADDVAEGDAFSGFNGLDGLAGGDAAEQRETISATAAAAGGENVNGAAAIVRSLEQAFVLQIGDVLVHGGERTKSKAAGNLLIRRGVPVLMCEAGEKVEDLFLPPRDSHAGIVANKKRIAIAILVRDFLRVRAVN
jgi:hypothetical protein